MSEKLYTVKELLSNDSFRRFVPYFLDKPSTIFEVAKQTRISRATITTIRNRLDKRYIEWHPFATGKPFELKLELLTDCVSEAVGLNLNDEEKKTINELFSDDTLNAFIKRNNLSLDMALMKVITFILIECAFNKAMKYDPKNYDPKNSKLNKKDNIPTSDKTIVFMLEYAKRNKNLLDKIASKVNASKFIIFLPISFLYNNMILYDFGGSTWLKSQQEIGINDQLKHYQDIYDQIYPKRKKAYKDGE
jgi:hypothetical protein